MNRKDRADCRHVWVFSPRDAVSQCESLAGPAGLCQVTAVHTEIMKLAQSPHIPAAGTKPQLRDLGWLAHFTLRGFWELVRARMVFARMQAAHIPPRNKAAKDTARKDSTVTSAELARIYYVLPRISDRLPWRSDCMVQAIAAQNWLASRGAAGEIQIGVENPEDGEFGAHAWLLYNEMVIVGGDISQYQLILSDSRLDEDSEHHSGKSK